MYSTPRIGSDCLLHNPAQQNACAHRRVITARSRAGRTCSSWFDFEPVGARVLRRRETRSGHLEIPCVLLHEPLVWWHPRCLLREISPGLLPHLRPLLLLLRLFVLVER